jgi:hypothetical protein
MRMRAVFSGVRDAGLAASQAILREVGFIKLTRSYYYYLNSLNCGLLVRPIY